MPSINEITKYVKKHVLLTITREEYKQRINKRIRNDLEELFTPEEPEKYIIWNAIEMFSYIRHAQGLLYVSSIFDNNNTELNKYLAKYYITSALSLICEYYNIHSERNSFSEGLAYQGETLLMTFACNRFELIEPCYPKIIESILNGKMSRSLPWGSDGEGNVVPPQPQRLGILAIEMMASERKQTIDWASANIPVDPFYQRFCQEALYSTDEQELTYWLTKLCDNHLQWTSLFLENAVKQPSTGYEIYDNMLLLWPFEYQAVRNFRARYGLSTPEIDHPLLKTPMAIDHRPNFALWQKPEWFDELVGKVTAVNPELNFVKEWVK